MTNKPVIVIAGPTASGKSAVAIELAKKLKRPVTISQEALEVLMAHDWPGNVRELRNVLEFSAYLAEGGAIVPETLPGNLLDLKPEQEQRSLSQRVRAFERGEIQKLLMRYGSTLEGKKKTAAELGISLATLYNKLDNAKF